MNFSEFKKLLGADPRSRDSDVVLLRNSDPEFEAAARQAEAFEDKLEAALHVPLPADLLEQIKSIGQQDAKRRNWMPVALAASLLIVIGAAGLTWKQGRQWDSIDAYLADHYSHDGATLMARAVAPVDKAEIDRMLASLDTSVSQQFAENIRFIKFCPTPDGRGAHMVINTGQGLMTVILMPHTGVTDGEVIEFQGMRALLLSLGPGSAAIIGEPDQGVETLQTTVRQALRMDVLNA